MLNKLVTKYRRRRLAKLMLRLGDLNARGLRALDRWARLCGVERTDLYRDLRLVAGNCLSVGSAGTFAEALALFRSRAPISYGDSQRAAAIFREVLAAADALVARIVDLEAKLGDR